MLGVNRIPECGTITYIDPRDESCPGRFDAECGLTPYNRPRKPWLKQLCWVQASDFR